MKISLAEAIAATGGRLAANGGKEVVFVGVATDTRKGLKGKLFCALKGERFDAHEFLGAAVEGGAAGVLISREAGPLGVPAILAPDTQRALGLLAKAARRKAGFKVAA
ncbi:UDP-N-acetylmuramoyl-tripeptide--D-alanyl-D-alanine ligase, partial [bacterium]